MWAQHIAQHSKTLQPYKHNTFCHIRKYFSKLQHLALYFNNVYSRTYLHMSTFLPYSVKFQNFPTLSNTFHDFPQFPTAILTIVEHGMCWKILECDGIF